MKRNNNYINVRRSSSALNSLPDRQSPIPKLNQSIKNTNHSLYKEHLQKQIIKLENKTKKLQRQNQMYINLFVNSDHPKSQSQKENQLSLISVEPSFLDNRDIDSFYVPRHPTGPLTNSVVFPYIYYNDPYGMDNSLRGMFPKQNNVNMKELKKDIRKIKDFSTKLEKIENLQKIQIRGMKYLLKNDKFINNEDYNENNINGYEENLVRKEYEEYKLKKEINDYIYNKLQHLKRREAYNENMIYDDENYSRYKRRDHSMDYNYNRKHHNHSYYKGENVNRSVGYDKRDMYMRGNGHEYSHGKNRHSYIMRKKEKYPQYNIRKPAYSLRYHH